MEGNRLRERVRYQLKLAKQQGLSVYTKGIIRRKKYISLQRKYGFDSWHITPYELRPYAWSLVRFVNAELKARSVCEIGCGLGDIIRNIEADQRIGIDLSEKAISCAKILNKSGDILFKTGGFGESILPSVKIDLLITVNFIHNIPPDELASGYRKMMESAEVRYIIADSVRGEGYQYNHNDFTTILPEYHSQAIWKDEHRTVYLLVKIERGMV